MGKPVARSPSPHPVPLPMSKAPLPAPSPQGAPAALATPAPGQPRKGNGKRCLWRLSWPALQGADIMAGIGGRSAAFRKSTDNAFLQADKVTVAPEGGGFHFGRRS